MTFNLFTTHLVNSLRLVVLLSVFYGGIVILSARITQYTKVKSYTSFGLLPHEPRIYGGFASIVADVIWFYCLYNQEMSAQQLYENAEVIISLDMHFASVYRLAGLALMVYHKRYDLASSLLKKAECSCVANTDERIKNYYRTAYNNENNIGCKIT